MPETSPSFDTLMRTSALVCSTNFSIAWLIFATNSMSHRDRSISLENVKCFLNITRICFGKHQIWNVKYLSENVHHVIDNNESIDAKAKYWIVTNFWTRNYHRALKLQSSKLSFQYWSSSNVNEIKKEISIAFNFCLCKCDGIDSVEWHK